MADNQQFQIALNALLADQNKLMENTSQLAKDQLNTTRELVALMKTVSYKEVTSEVQNTQQAIQKAAETAKNFGSTNQETLEKTNRGLREAADKEALLGKNIEISTKKMKAFAIATSAIDGFVQGLRFTKNLLGSIIGLGAGTAKSLAHLGAAIIAIPFKMLSGLIHMSDQGGGNELQQALEDIRKEFGALRETSGRAIIDMAKGMKGQLAQTGLSVYRVFGNLAERLKTMQEYAHNLGPLFAVLAVQFVKNSEAIGAYYKGLGLTEEAQKAVAARSFALGTAVTETLREITNYSQQLSKAFNGAAGSAKEISRDMGTLMADFKHFGGISTKEIGQAVVYFRRLGVEVSKVLGVLDHYDNFEDAAKGAANLSQAFNLNVDALEMMKAQNPAARVDMLRKAFFQAGRSIEGMTRQERALLAQQSGLDDSTLDLVFSMKNQGQTYDQVTKKADAAKKKQLTQVQAMKALADSIERLVKSGSSGHGGFIDRFIQGFSVGIRRSHDFRMIMRDLRMDLMSTYRAGIQVGRAFEQMFPGVRDVFKGIADMFQPTRFRAMLRRVVETFKEFFKALNTDPGTALPNLLKNLKKNFFDWFEPNNPNGRRILDGFKSFFIALSNIAGGMLKIGIEGITHGITYITDLLTGRRKIGVPGANGAAGFIGQLLDPIIAALGSAGPALWTAIKAMFGAIWTKAGPWLEQNWLKIFGTLLGPSLIGIVGRTIATSIAVSFAKGLGGWVNGGGVTKAFEAVRGRFTQQVKSIADHATSMDTSRLHHLASPGATGAQGQAAAGAIRGANDAAKAAQESNINAGLIAKMALITLFIVVGMAGILFAIYTFAKKMQENHITIQSIIGAGIGIVTAAVAMVGIAGAIKLLSEVNINPGIGLKIAGGLVVIAAVVGAMVIAGVLIIEAFKGYKSQDVGRTVLMMAGISALFLAAAGVTAIAALVGGIALSGMGIGALAIGAGLAAISLTIGIMTTQGMSIMRAIDAFQPSPGFETKARIFVDIMKGVASFAASVAQLVAATRPGILDFIRGAGAEEQRATLRQVENTITTLGGALIRIVEAVRTNIQTLRGTEQELKAAQVLGDMLSGVSNLAQALRPPTEALSEPGVFARMFGASGPERSIGLVTDYVSNIGGVLSGFLHTISHIITGELSAGITPAQKAAIEVIPPILASVGTLAQALRPDPQTLRALNSSSDFAGALIHIGSFMTNTLHVITGSDLFSTISRVINTIATTVTNLNPQQLRAVQAAAPLIGPTVNVIGQIMAMLTATVGQFTGSTVHNNHSIDALLFFATHLFTGLQTTLPPLITSMRTAFAGITTASAASMAKGMESVTAIFQVLTTIPGVLRSIPSTTSVTASHSDISGMLLDLSVLLFGRANNDTGILHLIAQVVGGLTNSLASIINPAEFIQKINALKTVFDIVGRLPGLITDFASAIKGAQTDNIEQVLYLPFRAVAGIIAVLTAPTIGGQPNFLISGALTRSLGNFSGIPTTVASSLTGTLEAVDRILTTAGTVTARMQTMNIENIGHIVTEMVTKTNEISAALRGIRPINIETGLRRLGDSLGLGGSGTYQIQNRNFNVNIDFKVKFDNAGLDSLELAILRRNGPHPTRILNSGTS